MTIAKFVIHKILTLYFEEENSNNDFSIIKIKLIEINKFSRPDPRRNKINCYQSLLIYSAAFRS